MTYKIVCLVKQPGNSYSPAYFSKKKHVAVYVDNQID